ncbi:MAG: hypothetical protein CMN30_19690 [Sandaracinus sp.]|nr:hypothetical protein [Sandaracinus sp.]
MGESLFVTANGSRSGLWVLTCSEERTPLGPVARQQVEEAWSVVGRDVAALAHPERLHEQRTWRARLAGRVGSGKDESIDGRSLGVAAAIAQISLLADIPAPTDVVASATLGLDGSIGPVEKLSEKLEAIADWGLGVRRLLVAKSQVEDARGLVDARELPLEVLGAERIDEVVTHVFPDLFAGLEKRWTEEPQLANAAARTLFDLALSDARLLQDWSGFAQTARAVAAMATEARAQQLGELAAGIAERHIGQARLLPLDREWWKAQRRPVRLRLMAHAVQAAADAVGEDWEMTADTARGQLLEPSDQSREDFMLLGALGRLFAAWHRWELAEEFLDAALQGWEDIREPSGASFPLCERIRVAGVRGHRELVREHWRKRVVPLMIDPQVSPASRGFLALAMIRASVQCGDHAAALRDAEEWHSWIVRGPRHVQGSAARWIANALDAVNRGADADSQRAVAREIGQQATKSAAFCGILVDLDEALRDADEMGRRNALERLRLSNGADMRRFEQMCGNDDATLGKVVSEHWRY